MVRVSCDFWYLLAVVYEEEDGDDVDEPCCEPLSKLKIGQKNY